MSSSKEIQIAALTILTRVDKMKATELRAEIGSRLGEKIEFHEFFLNMTGLVNCKAIQRYDERDEEGKKHRMYKANVIAQSTLAELYNRQIPGWSNDNSPGEIEGAVARLFNQTQNGRSR